MRLFIGMMADALDFRGIMAKVINIVRLLDKLYRVGKRVIIMTRHIKNWNNERTNKVNGGGWWRNVGVLETLSTCVALSCFATPIAPLSIPLALSICLACQHSLHMSIQLARAFMSTFMHGQACQSYASSAQGLSQQINFGRASEETIIDGMVRVFSVGFSSLSGLMVNP